MSFNFEKIQCDVTRKLYNYSRLLLESLFSAVGARTIEGNGSRVRFELNGVVATFHRPHPQKEAKSYQVRDAKSFLEKAGRSPQKPYSGNIMLRIPPELHARVAMMAEVHGKSLNSWVMELLSSAD